MYRLLEGSSGSRKPRSVPLPGAFSWEASPPAWTWSQVHSNPRHRLASVLQCHGLGSCPACSLTCLVLFVLAALPCPALPCPGWLAAPLRTGNGSSMPEGRSSRDRTAPSAGMQPQPSLCSSASKCEGGTFWLPSPWLVLKPLRDPPTHCPELSAQPSCHLVTTASGAQPLLGGGADWRCC